jgi:NAD(P)-dependent dehydrogenase (short-subunit alcohol dehydrogenase family)
MKTAIVIGVGPERGLGAQLCKRFAADGLKVIVAGRTPSALQAVADDVTQAGGVAVPFVADATKESDIVALFDAAGESLDLAVYNAGNNTPGKIIEMDADYFENAWRVVCFGGFLFGREDSLIDIEGIVDGFAFLYRQPERAWSFELDVRTSKEKW